MPTLIDRPVEGNSKGRKKVFESSTSAIRKKANELLSTSLRSPLSKLFDMRVRLHQTFGSGLSEQIGTVLYALLRVLVLLPVSW